MTWSLLINVFLLEGILNIITFLTFPTVCSALKKKQQLCINTPRKLNVEPEHMPLEQETIPSETTIFRFHVIFSEVTRNSKDLELRKKHIDSFNPELLNWSRHVRVRLIVEWFEWFWNFWWGAVDWGCRMPGMVWLDINMILIIYVCRVDKWHSFFLMECFFFMFF